MKSQKTSFSTLQAGRAVAAIMVVLFHLNVFIIPNKLYDGIQMWQGFNFGFAGVEFFFVLSGFIMAYIHGDDFGQPRKAVTFMRKRVVRIYPFYWLVLLGLLALYFLIPGAGPPNARDPWAIVTSFLLVPMPEEPILGVAWTLSYEMFFYTLFMVMILNEQIGKWLVTAWFCLCAWNLFAGAETFPLSFIFSAYNLLFLAGIVSERIFRNIRARAGIRLCWAGVAVFFLIGIIVSHNGWGLGPAWRTIAFGVAATAIVTGAAAAERKGIFKAHRIMHLLGDASYSIYLVHMPFLLIASTMFAAVGIPGVVPAWIMFTLLAIGATAAGLAVHLLVERPLLVWLNGYFRKPAAPVIAATDAS